MSARSARFKILDSFEIPRRGPVLLGDIVDGALRPGMLLRVPGGDSFVISAVEFADTVSTREFRIGLRFHNAPTLAELRVLLPVGIEVDITEPPASPACHRALRRYWFPISPGLGIGVTETSEDAAYRLAEQTRAAFFPDSVMQRPIDDIDVSTLDGNHVLPNAGPPNVRGVWFPWLNR